MLTERMSIEPTTIEQVPDFEGADLYAARGAAERALLQAGVEDCPRGERIPTAIKMALVAVIGRKLVEQNKV